MPDNDLIIKTEEYLKRTFASSQTAYWAEHPEAKDYRLEHTYRVANIGRQIAEKEGFDATLMVIACLLHDISYCEEFEENEWQEHGRRSARIARPFLRGIGLTEAQVNEICFGIAIHVDDKADFEGERTPLALSVIDADNIDRFDVYRIHEGLSADRFLEMSYEEKKDYAVRRLARLRELLEIPMATATANELWRSRLSFYIEFYEKLVDQLEFSKSIRTDLHI